ncbi:MAG: GNAT family N-acetyltransferase [Pseudomonadota bacterium]
MLTIETDDLSRGDIARLLQTHLDFCKAASRPENVHALDMDGLRVPEITFWRAIEDETLLGCVALKELDPTHGEIKSMHTLRAARGRGVGQSLLDYLIVTARSRGYTRLSLETGTMKEFSAAKRLYERNGFAECPPFANYFESDESVCMTKEL